MHCSRQPLPIGMSDHEEADAERAEVPPPPPGQQQDQANADEEGDDGNAGDTAHKRGLKDEIEELKSKRDALKKERRILTSQFKAAQRKRRRLKKKAINLTALDLFELCRMKSLNTDSMQGGGEQRNGSAASSAGAGAALNCEFIAFL